MQTVIQFNQRRASDFGSSDYLKHTASSLNRAKSVAPRKSKLTCEGQRSSSRLQVNPNPNTSFDKSPRQEGCLSTNLSTSNANGITRIHYEERSIEKPSRHN